MKRVLVCGGRDFNEADYAFEVLDRLHAEIGIGTIIEGDARGADEIGGQWADTRGIKLEVYPANWKKYRSAAGPIRNKQMLDEGKPDLVVAFPGGKGTANMIGQAREAGVEVQEIADSEL